MARAPTSMSTPRVRVAVRQHTFAELGTQAWRHATLSHTWPIDIHVNDRRLSSSSSTSPTTTTTCPSPSSASAIPSNNVACVILRLTHPSSTTSLTLPLSQTSRRNFRAIPTVPPGRLRFEILLSNRLVASGALIVAPVTPILQSPFLHAHSARGTHVTREFSRGIAQADLNSCALQLDGDSRTPSSCRAVKFTFNETSIPRLKSVMLEIVAMSVYASIDEQQQQNVVSSNLTTTSTISTDNSAARCNKHGRKSMPVSNIQKKRSTYVTLPLVDGGDSSDELSFMQTLYLRYGQHRFRFRCVFQRSLKHVTDVPPASIGWDLDTSTRGTLVSHWLSLDVLDDIALAARREERAKYLAAVRREHGARAYTFSHRRRRRRRKHEEEEEPEPEPEPEPEETEETEEIEPEPEEQSTAREYEYDGIAKDRDDLVADNSSANNDGINEEEEVVVDLDDQYTEYRYGEYDDDEVDEFMQSHFVRINRKPSSHLLRMLQTAPAPLTLSPPPPPSPPPECFQKRIDRDLCSDYDDGVDADEERELTVSFDTWIGLRGTMRLLSSSSSSHGSDEDEDMNSEQRREIEEASNRLRMNDSNDNSTEPRRSGNRRVESENSEILPFQSQQPRSVWAETEMVEDRATQPISNIRKFNSKVQHVTGEHHQRGRIAYGRRSDADASAAGATAARMGSMAGANIVRRETIDAGINNVAGTGGYGKRRGRAWRSFVTTGTHTRRDSNNRRKYRGNLFGRRKGKRGVRNLLIDDDDDDDYDDEEE